MYKRQGENESKKTWDEKTTKVAHLLTEQETKLEQKSLSKNEYIYQELLNAHHDLSYPIEANRAQIIATDDLSNSLCLQAHKTLTQIASIKAMEIKDTYSHGFYSRLSTELSKIEAL